MTPEERKEYNKKYNIKNKEKIKEYYENNKEKIKEQQKEYKKEYYEKNKEQIKEYQKEYNKKYRENNLEQLKEQKKEYYETNKEKIKEYSKTEQGRKISRISDWKRSGVINNDFTSLYEHYINCNKCENCNIELIEGMYGSNKRCLDHDHETGLFRNVLCNTCNIKRG
tara:strand:- start:72 stop:575 length:504 start_codon:yes stop_codon:yes gene_type:complete